MGKISPAIYNYFQTIRYLRSVQDIIYEIIQVDNIINEYNEDVAIEALNYYISKYEQEIDRIGHVYSKVNVIKNDKDVYKSKDRNQLLGDLEYVRDCMIVVAIVKAGIFCSIESAIIHLEEYEE